MQINKAQQPRIEDTLEPCRMLYHPLRAERKEACQKFATTLSYLAPANRLPASKDAIPALPAVRSHALQAGAKRGRRYGLPISAATPPTKLPDSWSMPLAASRCRSRHRMGADDNERK